jgi:uncharacterized membrane protein
MKMSLSLWQVLTLLALILPTLYLLWAWPTLPALIPSHFGPSGIDGYTPRTDAWLLTTALPLGIYLLLLFLPRLDPRRRVAADSRSFHKISLLLVAGTGALACYSLYLALHPELAPGRGLNVGLALFFALLGNYLTTVPPNYFLGLRTPWVLESDGVWNKTHRLVGRLYFGGGLAVALLAALGPEGWFELVFMVLVVGTGVLAYGYSYWLYRQAVRAA